MFEGPESTVAAGPAGVAAGLEQLVEAVTEVGLAACDDTEAVDCLHLLERLKSAAAATQARLAVRLETIRLSDDLARGVPDDEAGRGVGHEVALARRESPHHGRQHLAMARTLVHDLPETLAALSRGDLSERRAQIMARETAVLSREDRRTVDASLAHRFHVLGDRALLLAARRLAYDLDEALAARRMRRARAERRVTMRPLPDGMALISATVPAAEGTAVLLSLIEYADARRAAGDERTRAQVICDTFTQRLVGLNAAMVSTVPVEIQLVMNAEMLLGDAAGAAHLRGHGPIPSTIARELLATSEGRVFVRRLFANPDDNTLVAMESGRQLFEGQLRQLLTNRDEVCRTAWCDAPIRHGDHITSRCRGGATSLDNGQGLCEACNYAKESPGWAHRSVRPWPHRHQVDVRTPSGHTYSSQAPPLPVEPSDLRAGASTKRVPA